jgi:phytoene dehydrogenase-like protein
MARRRPTPPHRRGRAGVLVHALNETERLLGVDGPRWRRVFGPLAEGFDELVDDLLRPVVHLPQHPLRLASFGPAVMVPATVHARMWRTADVRSRWWSAAVADNDAALTEEEAARHYQRGGSAYHRPRTGPW